MARTGADHPAEKVKATFRLPKPLVKALRLHAVTVEQSQEALVERAIRELLTRERGRGPRSS